MTTKKWKGLAKVKVDQSRANVLLAGVWNAQSIFLDDFLEIQRAVTSADNEVFRKLPKLVFRMPRKR